MALANGVLGRAPLAGEEVLDPVTPGQQPAPDVPGGTEGFQWTVLPYNAPLAGSLLAGGALIPSYPGGGVTLVPDSDAGVMRVLVWWPDADGLLMLRITPDGVRTPVRGGYPLTITAATRTNLCTNPDLTTATTGYTAGTGAPTLASVARTDSVGGTALRATVAAGGTDEVVLPATLGRATAVTIGLDLQLSALPTAVSVAVAWSNAQGTALGSTTATLTADQHTASVGQYYRQVLKMIPPAAAAASTSVRITATGMPAGGWLALDRVTVEGRDTDGSYFDGDSLGARWTGTAELSTSVLPPQQTLLDGECPLDLPVRYLVGNPAITGGAYLSEPATLPSGDRTWLTHPGRPDAPFVVVPQSPTPALDRDVEQGVFYVLDRSRPIVRSAAQRRSNTGTLSLGALTEQDKVNLDTALDDLQPLLLRTPEGYDPGDMWVALGKLTRDPEGRLPTQTTRIYRAAFWEVDAPDASSFVTT